MRAGPRAADIREWCRLGWYVEAGGRAGFAAKTISSALGAVRWARPGGGIFGETKRAEFGCLRLYRPQPCRTPAQFLDVL